MEQKEIIDIGELESKPYDYDWQKLKHNRPVERGWNQKNITGFGCDDVDVIV